MAQIGAQFVQAVQPVPVGTVLYDWPADAAIPAGWIATDGQAISRADYPQLFSLLGTTYGAGNGSTTFNVPKQAMYSDTAGRVMLPYQPSFKAYANGGGQINNPSTNTTLVFGDVSTFGGHNVGGHYNTGNGRFTAPIAGRYWFSFNMLTNPAFSTNDPGHATVYIAINGTRTHYMAHNHNAGWVMEGSMIVLNLAANDYVTMLLDYGSGHYGTYSYFCGGLLG